MFDGRAFELAVLLDTGALNANYISKRFVDQYRDLFQPHITINPVDTKLRTGTRGTPPDGEHPRVVGFDVSGIIQGKGTDVKGFEVGDEVVYASGIVR